MCSRVTTARTANWAWLGPSRTESSILRVNPFLHAGTESNFHAVQLDCGGMHTVALTNRNEIVTWGVNDNAALGRPTAWSCGVRDMDDEEDEDGDNSDGDGDINPLEATPAAIPSSAFPPDTIFTRVAAGDSISLALTNTGLVYGWDTFVDNNGNTMFGYDTQNNAIVEKQETQRLFEGLAGITQIACGANHALALDANKDFVYTCGCNYQDQLE